MAGGGAGEDVGGGWREADVASGVLGGRGGVRDAVDGRFEFACVPKFDGVIAPAGYDETTVAADVEAACPGVFGMGVADFCCWPCMWAISIPHDETAVKCCSDKHTAASLRC